MFAALNFDHAQPYALQFLRRFASTKKDELDRQTYEGAKMLIELSVLGKSKSFNILLLFFRQSTDWGIICGYCCSRNEVVDQAMSTRDEMGRRFDLLDQLQR